MIDGQLVVQDNQMLSEMTDRELNILRYLRDKTEGTDKILLNETINGTLAMHNIQRVCEIINDEYLMEGVEKDYSPNIYGKELKKLIDLVNKPRLRL